MGEMIKSDGDGNDNVLVEFQNRISKLSAKRKIYLLSFVENYGINTKAAEDARVSRVTPWLWRTRKGEEAFQEAYRLASQIVTERMEQELMRRAMVGNRRYKYTTKGEPIIDPRTHEQAYDDVQSDLLGIFMMKAANPGKYRDDVGQQVTVIGKSITLHQGPSIASDQ